MKSLFPRLRCVLRRLERLLFEGYATYWRLLGAVRSPPGTTQEERLLLKRLERAEMLRWRFTDESEALLDRIEAEMTAPPPQWAQTAIHVQRCKIGDRRRLLAAARCMEHS